MYNCKTISNEKGKNGTRAQIGIHWDHLSLDVDPIRTISDSK